MRYVDENNEYRFAEQTQLESVDKRKHVSAMSQREPWEKHCLRMASCVAVHMLVIICNIV